MHIHCFQHIAFEDPGTIAEWIKQNGHTISFTYFFEEEYEFPSINSFDCLLVLGGNMNVDEEAIFPFLKEEKQFIKRAIDAGKKVMGICLGSQLIAAALGNKVYKAEEKEIGFFPVTFSVAALQHKLFNHFAKEYLVFQWHGDTFNLPQNAMLAASTNACTNQAFIIGNDTLGLQFHLEMNETILDQMLLHDGHELVETGTYIQHAEQIKSNLDHLAQNKTDIFILLDKFLIL